LVTPLLVELSRAERLRIAELAAGLDALGFELAELSGGSWALVATPADLDPETARGVVAELASDREASPENLVQRILDALAAESACKAAVKMHHPLGAEKLEALVGELFRAENPYACPHGRPVVLVMTDADLERRFGRR
jgi:DNA mismatch repair protein MutL